MVARESASQKQVSKYTSVCPMPASSICTTAVVLIIVIVVVFIAVVVVTVVTVLHCKTKIKLFSNCLHVHAIAAVKRARD